LLIANKGPNIVNRIKLYLNKLNKSKFLSNIYSYRIYIAKNISGIRNKNTFVDINIDIPEIDEISSNINVRFSFIIFFSFENSSLNKLNISMPNIYNNGKAKPL